MKLNNMPNTSAIHNKKSIINSLIIVMLVVLWICFLLSTSVQSSSAEYSSLLQAYMKNLGILLKDKVCFFIGISARQFI